MNPKVMDIATTDLLAGDGFQHALTLAAQHAEDVDRDGRFPYESIEALRSAGAL